MKYLEIVTAMDGCESALASMVYKFFDKKIEQKITVNEQLAEELCKPVIKRFKRKKSKCQI